MQRWKGPSSGHLMGWENVVGLMGGRGETRKLQSVSTCNTFSTTVYSMSIRCACMFVN